jgi:hypothetical protein
MAENCYPTGMAFGYSNYVAPANEPAPTPPKPTLLFDACPLCGERGFAVLRAPATARAIRSIARWWLRS